MKLVFAVFLGLLAAVASSPVKSLQQNFVQYSADLVEKINSMNTTWKAGPNFAGETAASVLERFSTPPGLSLDKAPKGRIVTYDRVGALPTEFDARSEWPNCPSIGRVPDQGRCRASWAITAVNAITDRLCIVHPGLHRNFSAEDVVTCTPYMPVKDNGCAGGYNVDAWLYWVGEGIVSGGGYQSSSGCKPYAYKPCDHYQSGSQFGPCQAKPDSTVCNKTCVAGYPMSYEADKKKGAKQYSPYGESSIQYEIMNNGPVSGDMTLYEDLLTYKSGVYQCTGGAKLIGFIAVKVIGWGVENNQKYWLCVNSWNTEWGDKGMFKILRGGSHLCALEDNIHAGTIDR